MAQAQQIQTQAPPEHFWTVPFAGCLLINIVLAILLRLKWPNDRKKANVTEGGSGRANYAAFLLVSTAFVSSCGLFGLYIYLFDAEYDTLLATRRERLYGNSNMVLWLSQCMVGYQLYNTILCLYLKEERKVEVIVHHVLTAALSFFTLHPFVHAYTVLFIGLAELTNIPLGFVDASRKGFLTPSILWRGLFAVSFILIRVLAWPIVSVYFWMDLLGAMKEGADHNTPVCILFLVANAGLTGLQQFWGLKIMRQVKKLLCPAKKNE